jgi:hypothetical protein
MTWMTISETARKVPTTNGKAVGTATIWRWCTRGCRGVKLEHARFGRRIAISEEALERFAATLAQAWAEGEPQKPAKPAPRKPKARTAAQREKAIAAAEARLKARGCMSVE